MSSVVFFFCKRLGDADQRAMKAEEQMSALERELHAVNRERDAYKADFEHMQNNSGDRNDIINSRLKKPVAEASPTLITTPIPKDVPILFYLICLCMCGNSIQSFIKVTKNMFIC